MVGSSFLMLIIGATTIQLWPRDFVSGLVTAFEIFLFLVFLLYLFSLYLMCCSGRVDSNAASVNMRGVWVILFVCYCMMVAEVTEDMRSENEVNVLMMLVMYLLYISFQMLLLAASDLQSEVIGCYYQMKLMIAAVLFGWILDLDTLSAVCCGTKSKWNKGIHGADCQEAGVLGETLEQEHLELSLSSIGPEPIPSPVSMEIVRSTSDTITNV